jgi:hypothetical protein
MAQDEAEGERPFSLALEEEPFQGSGANDDFLLNLDGPMGRGPKD